MPKQKGKPRYSTWSQKVAREFCFDWGIDPYDKKEHQHLLELLAQAEKRGIRMGRMLAGRGARGLRPLLTRHKLGRGTNG